jgi:hypothetical protein
VLEDEPKRFQTKVLLPLADVKQSDVEAAMPAKEDWASGNALTSTTFHPNGVDAESVENKPASTTASTSIGYTAKIRHGGGCPCCGPRGMKPMDFF